MSLSLLSGNEMTTKFDPYQQWLGISPEKQPPDNYLLLGVKQFEASLETIKQGAEKQLAKVNAQVNGLQTAIAKELAQRIESARACLLNPQAKKNYDVKLKSHAAEKPKARQLKRAKALPTASAKPVEPLMVPIVATSTAAEIVDEEAIRDRRSQLVLWASVGGGVAALLVLLIVIALSGPSRSATEHDPQGGGDVAVTTAVQENTGSSQSGSVELTLPQLIKKVEPSVVRIAVTGPLGRGFGSGFFIDDNATLVTNYHELSRDSIRFGSRGDVRRPNERSRSRILGS
jgi:hypothetical protein